MEKHKYFIVLAILLVSLALAHGCAKKRVPTSVKKPATQRPYTIKGKTYYPRTTAQGYSETGLASWYGPNFHGRRTSNGEFFNMEAMTAAHKTLPMNTWAEVANLGNGRKVKVRINDRGPFVDGRVIDLSKSAARQLGIIPTGTAQVRVTALGFRQPSPKGAPPVYARPSSYTTGSFSVQVGAFAEDSNAYRLAAKLRTIGLKVSVVSYDRGDTVFHRVRVGKYSRLHEAAKQQSQLRSKGYARAFAVSD